MLTILGIGLLLPKPHRCIIYLRSVYGVTNLIYRKWHWRKSDVSFKLAKVACTRSWPARPAGEGVCRARAAGQAAWPWWCFTNTLLGRFIRTGCNTSWSYCNLPIRTTFRLLLHLIHTHINGFTQQMLFLGKQLRYVIMMRSDKRLR